MQTVSAEQTKAYGLWRVILDAGNGVQVEGWGVTQQEAGFHARQKAQHTASVNIGRSEKR